VRLWVRVGVKKEEGMVTNSCLLAGTNKACPDTGLVSTMTHCTRCMYIDTCIHTLYMHTCTYMHTYTHMHTCMYTSQYSRVYVIGVYLIVCNNMELFIDHKL
jgi:hypothetical protein